MIKKVESELELCLSQFSNYPSKLDQYSTQLTVAVCERWQCNAVQVQGPNLAEAAGSLCRTPHSSAGLPPTAATHTNQTSDQPHHCTTTCRHKNAQNNSILTQSRTHTFLIVCFLIVTLDRLNFSLYWECSLISAKSDCTPWCVTPHDSTLRYTHLP